MLFLTVTQVIVKMDKNGNGLEIDQKNLGRCASLGDMFTEEKFRYMCILSGCDYLPSIYGIGLGKACKLIKMARNPDILKVTCGPLLESITKITSSLSASLISFWVRKKNVLMTLGEHSFSTF